MSRPTKIGLLLGVTGLFTVLLLLNWTSLTKKATVLWYTVANEPEQVRNYLRAWGPVGAPLAFVGLQVLQVVFAPFPGEASGFVGGYVFGTLPGFFYSSLGLTVGSFINFALARILGRRYVRKWIQAPYLNRFDAMARRQGIIVFFLFFLLPGFPKDYLCLFLGLTNLSVKVFIPMVAIGRMPGTLMLSLQGARVFERDYLTLALLVAICLAFIIPAYCYRERIYAWIERTSPSDSLKP